MASRASEPVAASVLAEREAARRDGLRARGPFGSGCRGLDEYVLMGGGFERGSVVGVSASDDEGFGLALGLQVLVRWLCRCDDDGRALVVTPKPAGPLLAALRAGIETEVEATTTEEDRTRRVGTCLDRVMLSCVFDVDGLCEVLAELGGGNQEEVVVADSQDEADDVVPALVVVAHLSALLTGLFAHRDPQAAHDVVEQLSQHLRQLARHPGPTAPLIMLLNSTTTPSDPAALDPTLRSVFAPPPPQARIGPDPNRHHHHHTPVARSLLLLLPPPPARPAFGLVFARLLDLHLLCTPMPGTADSADSAVAVEVLVDHLGLWQGRRGPRPSREQRWAPVRLVAARVVDAFASTP